MYMFMEMWLFYCDSKEVARQELVGAKMGYDISCCNMKEGVGREPVDTKIGYETICMIQNKEVVYLI